MKPNKSRSIISISLLLGLLFFRFPWLLCDAFEITNINNAYQIKIICTYVLTAILIWWERDHLEEFNIRLTSLLLFIALPILLPVNNSLLKYSLPWGEIKLFFPSISIVTGIILAVALLIYRPSFKREKLSNSFKWLIISIACGIAFGVLVGLVYSEFKTRTKMHVSLPIFFDSLIMQLRNAALSEEPLFRGFLWGYLRKLNWKDNWIWLFQAFLFMVGHIYYIKTMPIALLFALLAGLMFGLVAWKSKSISSSIIAHGLANTMGDLVTFYRW